MPCEVAISGEWYELGAWAKKHPGGEQIIKHFHGFDATDAFFSLHSEKAIKQLKLMKPIESKRPIPEASKFDKAYRELKTTLQSEGWWKRDVLSEAKTLVPILAMLVWGTINASTYPMWSIFSIGVAMCQAGWLGHDMVHARNSMYCTKMARVVSGWINGFDSTWWSRKHNTHHVFTNHVGVDPDIDMMPILFLMAPNKEMDRHFRRWQHFYCVPVYSFLFVLWRYQSFIYAWRKKDMDSMIFGMLPGYIWLSRLPLLVSFGSIMFAGLLVAVVVVQSHEAEEKTLSTKPGSFAMTQFDGTMDIVCPDPITEYWFGGMQYQLAHHLFPTMPRYKYPALQKRLISWSKEQGVEYKRDGVIGSLVKHFGHLRAMAFAECDQSCPSDGWSIQALD